ncbi:MAG TPA: hypothetical protein PKW95_24220 [bacterium]|nr:hypothetical protein [bacterium]
MRSHESIGEILIQAGLISETQLKAALSAQKTWGGRVGTHLVKAGALSEEKLLDALSHQLGIAKINFRRSRIYIEALQMVPKHICEKYGVVPVAVKEGKGRRKILLAMADPTNFEAIQEVEFASNYNVVTVIALESDIERAIRYCYHPDGLRASEGLSELADVIEIDADKAEEAPQTEPIIITPEGEIQGLDNRNSQIGLRALIDILIAKGFMTLDEFHQRLQYLKNKE